MAPWTNPLVELAGLGAEISVEHASQQAAVIDDICNLRTHDGPPTLRVRWQIADLDLSAAELVGDEDRRRIGAHPQGLAIARGALTGLASRDHIQIGGVDDDAKRMSEDYQSVFGTALTYVLSLREYYPLHGAAIARGDEALLLLGNSGAGKSTAVWGSQRADFELIADDTVFIRRGSLGYEVSGMTKPVALPSEILEEIPPQATQDPIRGGGRRDRWHLPPTILKPGWHRVVGIVTPMHGVALAGALEPRSRTTLLSEAIGAYYACDQDDQFRSWFPHAGALCRVPAWDLHHSPDATRRLDTAAHWLGVAFDAATAASGAA